MPPPASAASPYVVLVAEDEEFARLVAVEILIDEGYIVLEAEHAADAVALLEAKAGGIHVLFADHLMPGEMKGFDLVHHTHHKWPWICLILTSGDLQVSTANLPPGCRFLPKPYLPHHVVSHVRDLVALGG